MSKNSNNSASDANTANTANLQTITEYKTRVATVLTALYQSKQIGTGISNLAHASGLPSPTVTSTNVTFEIPEEVPVVGDGSVKFEDLNPEAQVRTLAETLQSYKRRLYRDLKAQTNRGNIQFSEVVAVLQALDLPVPTVETEVSGYVYDEDGDSYYIHVVVPEEVTQGQAQERLDEVSEGSRKRQFILAAFPNARDLDPKAEGVTVTPRRTWASESEIVVEVPAKA